MREWKEAENGAWRLSGAGRSLCLPPSYQPGESNEKLMSFEGETPDGGFGWVFYVRAPAADVVQDEIDKGESKLMGTYSSSGIEIVEVAPTTASGRAQAHVRLYFLPLTETSSLVVIGNGGKEFAADLASQWAQDASDD